MLRALATIVGILLILALVGAGAGIYVFVSFGRDLPDYRQLADYERYRVRAPMARRLPGSQGHSDRRIDEDCSRPMEQGQGHTDS